VAERAGNGLWLSFVIAAVIAGLIGLCYAELASMFPRAGADYEYTRQAAGPRPAFVVGWLMVIGNIVAAATVALGFGGYLATLIDLDATVIAIAALGAATVISFYGIEQTVRVSVVGTFVEVAGLVLVVAVGVPHLGEARPLDFDKGAIGVLAGASLVMFAFLGFSQIATLAEEAEDAARVVPRAMLISIAVCTLLYLLVAVSALAVLGSAALGASSAPLADVAAEVLGRRASDAVALIALFSTGNTMLLLLVAASRLIYGMARGTALPRFLAWVHPGRRTPLRAILISFLLAAAFALTGELSFVAGATNFAVFVGFGAACVSLLVLRRREPALSRPFRVPLQVAGTPVVPVLGLVLTAVLMANLGAEVLIVGVALLLSGLVAMEVLALWQPEPPHPSEGARPDERPSS
jgi:APA family basic amino acid/polyamine antiporter